MRKQKPIIDQSLSERADERERVGNWRAAAAVASALVNVGLAISAILTVIYLMLLVDDAAGLPDPYGLMFGLLVGVVAIVPAELALVIWRARLAADDTITRAQRVTAVIAMLAAGMFSALTTSSFFSYFLPQLFPQSYMAIAPALNVGAIVGSWIVFILAIVAYSIGSRQTQQNLSQAKAHQAVFDARMTVLKSAAEAIRIEAEAMVKQMDDAGVFKQDAQNLILASLGMDNGRLAALPAPPTNQTDQERRADDTDRARRERLADPEQFSLVDWAAMAATGASVNGVDLVADSAGEANENGKWFSDDEKRRAIDWLRKPADEQARDITSLVNRITTMPGGDYSLQILVDGRWVTAINHSHYDDAIKDANERFDEGETAVRIVNDNAVAYELGNDANFTQRPGGR